MTVDRPVGAPHLGIELLDLDPSDAVVTVDVAEATAQAWRFDVTIHYTGDRPAEGALRLTVSLPSADPSWLIPGAFYGENRPEDNDRVFPRFEQGAHSAQHHAAMVSDEWHFRADRAATPAVFCWSASGEGGLALSTTETGELGLQSLGFRHREGVATLSVTAPAREFPVTYYGSAHARPAEELSAVFEPGSRSTVSVTVHALSSDRHDYARVLRTLHDASKTSAPLRPRASIEEAAHSAAHGLVRWHFDPDPGVLLETAGFDRELSGADGNPVDRQAMHVGWISGIPWAMALLQHGDRVGDRASQEAGIAVMDFIASNLSPSGTFWGVWYRDRGWRQSWSTTPGALHARTLGEATDFLLRAIALHDSPLWRRAAQSNLDAVVARQRVDGNLGALHHAVTGEVLSWDGSAPLAWIPALVAGAELDGGRGYLAAAERAGSYYAQFVDREYLHGAPEDVDRAPTSEDGYVALMAYMALHRATGESRWLDLARRSADWALTFRYSYDVTFSPETLLGVYDVGTRGADQASSSNQHLHSYGLVCTEELFALAEATGDAHYRERALETLACFRQLVPLVDGDFNAYRGMISERYYQTTCFQPKGMVHSLAHAWCAGVLLLACEQTIARRMAAE